MFRFAQHDNSSTNALIAAIVDLIVSFPRLNSNRRIVYATCSWNQSARFHLIDKNRRRAETDQAERQFRERKYVAAFLSDGLYGHVHHGNVRSQCGLERLYEFERRCLWA